VGVQHPSSGHTALEVIRVDTPHHQLDIFANQDEVQALNIDDQKARVHIYYIRAAPVGVLPIHGQDYPLAPHQFDGRLAFLPELSAETAGELVPRRYFYHY